MMKYRSLIIIFTIVFISCRHKQEKADLVVHNAKIYTVDAEFSVVQAMAIKDGRIVELGAEREILNKYRADQFIDAKGRYIYPGFIDAHCHFYRLGKEMQQIDLKGTYSFDDVLDRVVNYSKEKEANWIIGNGWDQNDWEVKEFPNRKKLDSLFPETPVVLKRIDNHAVLANSAALKSAGITKTTQIEGGKVLVENDEMTGMLIDNAAKQILKEVPEPLEATQVEMLKAVEAVCFEAGITTVDDAGLNKSIIDLIDEMHKEGELKMQIYAMLSDEEENYEHYLNTGPYQTERLNVRSFKIYADGALGSRGAKLKKPYTDHSSNTGMLMHDSTSLREKAEQIYAAGFQMNSHCIGDEANRLMLGIYGEVLGGMNDMRWRIEHAQVVDPLDFELFNKFSVIPSVQPLAAISDMNWAEERLGEERVKGAYAYQQLKEHTGMIALGTDFPIEVFDPLKTFYAAVVRKNEMGFPKGGYQKENSLSREDAIRGMTAWAAMANFEENEKGSLEIGKSADFVVVNGDLMEVVEERILELRVVKTVVNGELVFDGE